MPQVRRHSLAERDLDDIVWYLYQQSGSMSVVEQFINTLEQKALAYARQPELGTMVDGFEGTIRQFLCKNYVVFYIAKEDGITILMITSSWRDHDAIFQQRYSDLQAE